jgi:tetratricopeptide (TPR) repeat protein
MDAVYSGQAATLALLEGAEAKIFRAGNDTPETMVREHVSYLFQGCSDVTYVRGADAGDARIRFGRAWRADRALRLLLIALDAREDEESLRAEAAEGLEELAEEESAKIFIENELYARPLPKEADAHFLLSENWPRTRKFISAVLARQTEIKNCRAAWDRVPDGLFEKQSKIDFEEKAIALGAFRALASFDPSTRDANLAILECYKVLRHVPDSRLVVTEWTKDLRRAGVRPIIIVEDADDLEEEPETVVLASGHAVFRNVIEQQNAITERMRAGNIAAARMFTDQLIQSQLKQGGPQYAAKSLCRLAQEAKYLGLHSLQLEWALRAVDLCPGDAWAHGQAADAYLEFSRLNEALAELQLSERTGDPQFAMTGRARVLRHQGKLDAALSAFREAQVKLVGHEDEPFAWAGSAETLRDMWRFEEALSEYEKGIARLPSATLLHCGRAAVLSDLGRLEEALNAYRSNALRHELVAMNGTASVLKEMGRFDEALAAITETVSLYPTDPVAKCCRAEILATMGDFKAALAEYEHVKRDFPSLTVAYSGFAEVLRDMRDLPGAIEAYGEAVSKFPTDARLANGYANIRKLNNELREALRLYEGNVNRFPYDLMAKTGRADLLKRLGYYDDALRAYDDIIDLWAGYAAAKNGKAAILAVRGEFELAEALLPVGLPRTRDDWVASHIRGMILLRKSDVAAAIAHFEWARRTTPFSRERRYFERALAAARIRRGEFSKAVETLEEGQGALTNIIKLHAYAAEGRLEKARVALTEVVSDCPESLVELREEIAARFRLIPSPPHHNNNWIFAREEEALLQDAA